MAAPNVEWIVSQKGKDWLTVNEYLFQSNGKGRQVDVHYWTCSTSGCIVRARTDGRVLVEVVGTVNDDHGHVNDSQQIANMRLKVNWNVLVYS